MDGRPIEISPARLAERLAESSGDAGQTVVVRLPIVGRRRQRNGIGIATALLR